MTEIVNREQFEAWNGESGERWVAEADVRDAVLAPIAERLLDRAGITAGMRVLDVGCGCGATTLDAAALAGDGGAAIGIDLSAPMLEVARDRATRTGTANVTFEQADAATYRLDPPADLVMSRFGTMFFDDPVGAFANIGHQASPAGRLCIATWQALADNEWLVVPGAVLLGFMEGDAAVPGSDPAAPGMFAQADADVVERVLAAAGWTCIDLEPHTVPIVLGADADAAGVYLANSGPGRAALEAVPPERVDEAIAAVKSALAPHATDDGVVLDGAIWVVTARRPS